MSLKLPPMPPALAEQPAMREAYRDWRQDVTEATLETHGERLSKLEAAEAKPKGLLGQLPAPVGLALLGYAMAKDPALLARLVSW